MSDHYHSATEFSALKWQLTSMKHTLVVLHAIFGRHVVFQRDISLHQKCTGLLLMGPWFTMLQNSVAYFLFWIYCIFNLFIMDYYWVCVRKEGVLHCTWLMLSHHILQVHCFSTSRKSCSWKHISNLLKT